MIALRVLVVLCEQDEFGLQCARLEQVAKGLKGTSKGSLKGSGYDTLLFNALLSTRRKTGAFKSGAVVERVRITSRSYFLSIPQTETLLAPLHFEIFDMQCEKFEIPSKTFGYLLRHLSPSPSRHAWLKGSE